MSLLNDLNSEKSQEPVTTLDRLWEATRPPEPPAEAWERVWEHVTTGLRQTPATISMPRTSRGPWGWIALASIAQAAAVLVAGAIYLQTHPAHGNTTPEVAVTGPPAPMIDFEVNEGQTLIVQVGERADRVFIRPELVDTASLMIADLEDAPTDPYADAVAFSMDILNVMEAID